MIRQLVLRLPSEKSNRHCSRPGIDRKQGGSGVRCFLVAFRQIEKGDVEGVAMQ